MSKSRAIASARAFLGIYFEILAEILGLNPKEDWHEWEDPEKNFLKITKRKTIRVYPSSNIPTTTNDVFRKAHPRDIAKHSYWMLVLIAKNKTIICFLGNDGILRRCDFEDNKWVCNDSPLLLGYQVLRYIINGYLETEPRKVKSIKLHYPISFEIEDAWASGYPSTNHELQELIECHLTNQDLTE